MSETRLLGGDGYIRLIEHWGSDERVVEAARMSTGKGFLGWGPNTCPACGGAGTKDGAVVEYVETENNCPRCKGLGQVDGDEKLMRYLYENRHDTPFEMAGMVVEVQAPIFVFREWHRHRVPWSYNEASARYEPLPDLDYQPSVARMMRGGGHLTKQAASADGAVVLTEGAAADWRERLHAWQRQGEQLYQLGLAWGVPKELARCAMSVARMSRMRASANLRGWLHFLGLRAAPNAQEEIRVYAEAAAGMLRGIFPRTMSLYDRT